ncbi:MAG: hypothetical protein F4Y53_02470 [Proteobacteria bacterium]|nr:hypothetical protein [Pseudomonadota bacterium]
MYGRNTKRVPITLTEGEIARLTEKANEQGMRLAPYLRSLVLESEILIQREVHKVEQRWASVALKVMIKKAEDDKQGKSHD